MIKKMIAALALQLAAVAVILSFSPVYEILTDKYGKDYTFDVDLWSCDSVYDSDKAGTEHYQLEIAAYYNKNIIGPTDKRFYDSSDDGNFAGLYCNDNRMDFNANIRIKDDDIGKKLCDAFYLEKLENSIDGTFDASVFNLHYDVKATVRIFGSRIKLLSVTIDGKDVEEFFRSEKNIIA